MAFYPWDITDTWVKMAPALGEMIGGHIQSAIVAHKIKPTVTTQVLNDLFRQRPDLATNKDFVKDFLGPNFHEGTYDKFFKDSKGKEGEKKDGTTTPTVPMPTAPGGKFLSGGVESAIKKTTNLFGDTFLSAPTEPAPAAATTVTPSVPSTTDIVLRNVRPLTNIGRAYGVAARDTNMVQQIDKLGLDVGVDPDVLWAIVEQESDFNPSSVGSSGELGLFQIMPQNLKAMDVNVDDPAVRAQYLKDPAWQFRTAAEWINRNKAAFPNIREPNVLAAVWNGGRLPQDIPDATVRGRVAEYQVNVLQRINALRYMRTGKPVLFQGIPHLPDDPRNLAGNWSEVK